VQDVAVEEQERAQRLVLGGGGNLALDGEGAEEARDLGGAHLGGMALVVEEDSSGVFANYASEVQQHDARLSEQDTGTPKTVKAIAA
jgi:hypothetical protein